jgi:hypothetical protein
MMDMAVVNAFIVYRDITKNMSMEIFRRAITYYPKLGNGESVQEERKIGP